MTVAPSPVALFLHDNYSPLLDLLRPHLPRSLPLYSTLQTPGQPIAVYSTLPPGSIPGSEEGRGRPPWLVLADLGNQLRYCCSYEAKTALSEAERAEGEELVGRALRLYLLEHHGGRDRVSLGAVPDIWTSCIERFFDTKPFSNSEIHYLLPQDVVEALPVNGATKGGVVLPGGVVATTGREEDVAEILSTSEVPHPPAYISTRLPYTAVLRSVDNSTDPSTDSTVASTPSSILAHCTTHRDGSIGTLQVSSSHRQRGLGALVLRTRISRMFSPAEAPQHVKQNDRDAAAFCYVHAANAASNALMRKVGMRKSDWEVWWARVKLPLDA
ncbi:hypothetical protein JCM10296v2_005901 [Rhodotorula toruloides]